MPNFISRVFSRRGRSHDEAIHAQHVGVRGATSAAAQQSVLGLKDICTQVAESLLADERLHQIPPDASRLERMFLANFTEQELTGFIESGRVFEVAVAADLLIQLGVQDTQLPERAFSKIALLMKPGQYTPQSQQQELLFQKVSEEVRGNQAVPSLDQIRTVSEQLQIIIDGMVQTKPSIEASSSKPSSSKPSKPKRLVLPSNWKKFYCPQASYSVSDLCGLFKNTNQCYDIAHSQQVLDELLTHLFLGQEHTPDSRMALCEALQRVMTERDIHSVSFDGRTYSDLFFVTLAADMALSQLKPNSSTAFRETVAKRLERLLSVSGEQVTQFTLRGEPCTRRDITFWVRNIRSAAHWVLPADAATTALAQGMEQALKVSDAQSVHVLAVMTTGNKVYDLMYRRVEHLPTLSTEDVRSQIGRLLIGRNNAAPIRLGLERVINDREVSTSIGVPTTPSGVLTILWQYIQHHERPSIRAALIEALLIRFAEIGSEAPCHVGRLERLLDVPSGIDERLNVFSRQKQIREEVRTIAGQVNELDLNAVQKVAEFQQRVEQQLVQTQGLTLTEVQPEVNFLIPGFVDDSDDER